MASRGKMIGTVVGAFVAAGLLAGSTAAQEPEGKGTPKEVKIGRFSFAPNTPIKDLLPPPPAQKPVVGPLLSDNLELVPELAFQADIEKPTGDMTPSDQLAFQLAKISFANSSRTDAFMAALIENRVDLAGLPFIMGKECRIPSDQSTWLRIESQDIRISLLRAGLESRTRVPTPIQSSAFSSRPSTDSKLPVQYPVHYYDRPSVRPDERPTPVAGPLSPSRAANASPPTKIPAGESSEPFWSLYQPRVRKDPAGFHFSTRARIAALMQILAAESREVRMGLVDFLANDPHADATKALARLAIYSTEDDVRKAATDSLKSRPRQDYTDILLQGLRYPLPAVARRSAEAIAQLRRVDLVPELFAIMSADDPRLPVSKTVDGKLSFTVREVVKVNHNRNCMLCHAPASATESPSFGPTASVPVPGQPLPSLSVYSSRSSPELRIRFDVTYLRQDFSAMQSVEDHKNWPEKQRFDFLVRERTLTNNEARDYAAKLTLGKGSWSPYQEAALAAMAELMPDERGGLPSGLLYP